MATSADIRIFFSDDELRYAQFANEDMREYSFNQSIISHGDFRRADFTGTKFVVRAYRADFSNANLTGAQASRSSFFGCSFFGANLRKADFSRVQFGNTDLTDANLTETDLFDADLQSVIGLTPKQLTAARNWRHAHVAAHVRHDAEVLEMLYLRREIGIGNPRTEFTVTAEPEIEIDLTTDDPVVRIVQPAVEALPTPVEAVRDTTRPVAPLRPSAAAQAARLYVQAHAGQPAPDPDTVKAPARFDVDLVL